MSAINPQNNETNGLLHTLPYELWLECMQWVSFESDSGPLPYITVSKRWSEAAVQSPSLWTTITVGEGEDEVARLHTFLHLSGNSLIDVRMSAINTEVSENKEIMHLIFKENGARIRSLVAETPTTLPDRSFTSLIGVILENYRIYPQLKTLKGRWDGRVSELLRACPNLRYLDENPIPMELEPSLGHLVEEIDFLPLENWVVHGFMDRKHLRSVTLLYTRIPGNDVYFPRTRTESMASHFQLLAVNLGPRLTALRIMVQSWHIWTLLNLLGTFNNLSTLSLSLSFTRKDADSESFEASASRLRLEQIRVLILKFQRLQRQETLDSLGISIKSPQKQAGDFLRSLKRRFNVRNLKTFELEASDFSFTDTDLSLLFNAITNTRRIHIHIASPPLSALGDKPRHLGRPVVQQYVPVYNELTELSVIPVDLLNYIQSPNVLSLELPASNSPTTLRQTVKASVLRLRTTGTLLDGMNRATPNSTTSSWPELHILTLISAQSPKNLAALSSIRTMEFIPTIPFAGGAHSAVNGFLQGLFDHPEGCPNLHTIKVAGYPSWELLFETLRRRNAIQVAQFKQLTLPAFPHRLILSILVKLLSGRVDIFTSKSADAAIAKRSYNQQIIACDYCLQAGYIHCNEGHVTWPSSIRIGDNEELIDLFGLESSEKQQGVPSRLWDEKSAMPPFLRQQTRVCSKHRGDFVNICDYTLDGI